jgi:hypothetical protein
MFCEILFLLLVLLLKCSIYGKKKVKLQINIGELREIILILLCMHKKGVMSLLKKLMEWFHV